MVRITKDPDERKKELLDAAERLFVTKGFNQTAVSDIVKLIGVAQGTFYYYFKKKEDIFDAVIDRYVVDMMEEIRHRAFDDDLNALEKVRQIIAVDFASIVGKGNLMTDIHTEQHMEMHNEIAVKMIKELEPMMMHILEQGIGEGYFKVTYPEETMHFLLYGILSFEDASKYMQDTEGFTRKILSVVDIVEKLFGMESGLLSQYFK